MPTCPTTTVCPTTTTTTTTTTTSEVVPLYIGCITKYHPINRLKKHFEFAGTHQGSPDGSTCAPMYAILLEKGVFGLVVEGLNCITLGHSIQNSIAAHPYFGTDLVRDDILARPVVRGYVCV